MKILFLSTRQAKPSFRFRVEQMLPSFRDAGHTCDVTFLPERLLARMRLYRRFGAYDAVFVQKRIFSPAELYFIRRWARHLIYDLDDAVMYDGQGQDDRRRRARFAAIVRAADLVIAGNNYLAEEAQCEGGRVAVVPTVVDSEVFHPRFRPAAVGPLVTIGWTGSRSTNRYLNEIFPVLAEFAGRAVLKIISDTVDEFDFSQLQSTPHEFVAWSPAVEVPEAATFDIGLMPLPDDRWTRGKCGFKALQYMGLGIPAVCSPVGVNRDIVEPGSTGFLPATREDWRDSLETLVANGELRASMGAAGRRRIEETYAVNVQGPRLVSLVEDVCRGAGQQAA